MSGEDTFKKELKKLNVTWDKAPDFTKIKKRVIIGPNGCGKSRLLQALNETLQLEGVEKNKILYADFPDMSKSELLGLNEEEEDTLRHILINRSGSRNYETLQLISKGPIEGVRMLLELSPSIKECKTAVAKINKFASFLLGDTFELDDKSISDILTGEKKLSPGQRSMLYMSVMLGVMSSQHKDDKFYILLDEPEQHLHEKATVDFMKHIQGGYTKNPEDNSIEKIEAELPNARLWIATHSVHLMATYSFNEIVYIEKSEVQPKDSKMYDKICKTMVDTEDMQHFVSFSGLYGFYEFFRECFVEPGSEGSVNDKLKQIQDRIRARNPKEILDYGAGKGRFFTLLSKGIPNLDTIPLSKTI